VHQNGALIVAETQQVARLTEAVAEGVAEVEESEEKPVPARTQTGQFVKGQSGNPAGRTKGTKNRITLARLMLEEGLREQLTNAGPNIMKKAIKMALDGDDKIMRVLLDKMLTTPKGDDGSDARDNEVRINITNLTQGAPAATKVEGHTVRVAIPQQKE